MSELVSCIMEVGTTSDNRTKQCRQQGRMAPALCRAATAIARAGANYGLVLRRNNVEVMLVRCDAAICKPDGSTVAFKISLA